jgi:hypothetical protein
MNLLNESLTSATSATLLQLLDALRARVGETAVDLLWIFPPQAERPAASGVVVAAVYDDGEHDRRRVFTAHFVRSVKGGNTPVISIEVAEHGSTPLGRVEGLIDGVLRRMEDGPGAFPPQRVDVAGMAERWAELTQAVQGSAGSAAGTAGA